MSTRGEFWESALTEEEVLEDYGLLRELPKVCVRSHAVGDDLLLDARPCQVHVEEKQQDAESYD